MSIIRSEALEHFVREVEAFKLDHGHEIGEKWDEKIHGFRLGLERILGNQPGSLSIKPQDESMNLAQVQGQEKGMDPSTGFGGPG
jgi:hypothetical protein